MEKDPEPAPLEKRIIRREVTQNLTLPIDFGMPIKEQCERELVSRLKGTPSEWGVMVGDRLVDLTVSEYVTPISYGTKVLYSIPVKALCEVVGYIVGDVLLEVSLAEILADAPVINQYRRVDILGLPFQITVRTRSTVSSMNIQIVDSRIAGALQYIAVPAFYPYYSPLAAHLASIDRQATSLYAHHPLVQLKPPPTPIEWRLVDPLHGMAPDLRKKRIIGEVRRMLGLLPSAPAAATPAAAPAATPAAAPAATPAAAPAPGKSAKSEESISVVNVAAALDGKATMTKVVADLEHPVVIEFIEATDAPRKAEMYAAAKCPCYTFAYVPSLPLNGVIAAVSWFRESGRIVSPTSTQVEQFAADYDTLRRFKSQEMAANRRIYGMKILTEETGTGPAFELLHEHLEAGLRLRKGLSIETATTGGGKTVDERASVEGKPLHIEPSEAARPRRGRRPSAR